MARPCSPNPSSQDWFVAATKKASDAAKAAAKAAESTRDYDVGDGDVAWGAPESVRRHNP